MSTDDDDFTSITDLPEFLHDEDEELGDLADPEEAAGDISSEATDPGMQFDSNDLNEDETSSFDSNDFGGESDFGSDDGVFVDSDDSFGSDDGGFGGADDSFGGESDFGGDSDFGGEEDNDFGGDDLGDFTEGSSDDATQSFEAPDLDSNEDDDPFGGEENNEEDPFGDVDVDAPSEMLGESDPEPEPEQDSFEEPVAALSETEEPHAVEQPAPQPPPASAATGSAGVETPPPPPADTREPNREEIEKRMHPPKTSKPLNIQQEKITQSENLGDLKKFAENISVGGNISEGNPPFSIIIDKIKYVEDISTIMDTLEKYGYLKADNKSSIEESLKRGNLLISRISEYAAILLVHQLRELDIELKMGLSEFIHPSKTLGNEPQMVSKRSVYQNRSSQFEFKDAELSLDDINVTTLSHFKDFEVVKYISIITESKNIKLSDYIRSKDIDDIETDITRDIENVLNENKIATNLGSSKNIKSLYLTMINQLKPQALKFRANAIIGINFKLVPSSVDSDSYEIVCTGNAVWLNKL